MTAYTKKLLGIHYCFLNCHNRGYMGRGKTSGEALLQALSIAANCGETA